MAMQDPKQKVTGPVEFSEEELSAGLPGEGNPGDRDADDLEPIVQENQDGSAEVTFAGEEEEVEVSPDFMENLADKLDETVLNRLGVTMLEHFERDKEARKRRDEQYAEGIKRTGLGNEAPGGAGFEGASRAVHPVLIEGCIEFSARSMKEIFPPSGPVKAHIIGEQTDDKIRKADRKKTYMNWQLTSQIKEYRAELEQTLTQVPLGGSQYLKVRWDDRLERPSVEFVPIDEMLLPFAASDFYSASRKTHMQLITEDQFEGRVESGLYRAVPVGSSPGSPEQTQAAIASDKVEGKEDTAYNEDGLRLIYESYCELSLEDDKFSKGKQRGYILTIDESSGKVLALYRNWDEHDNKPSPETLDWVVEFGFIPWRGAYKIGLAHIIGGLSGALTGALRAILDSAHIQNSATGLIMKGARTTGQTTAPDIGEFTQVEGPANVDDIRKLAMPLPFPGPSTVLFQLLDWLTNQAKGVVSTASEAIKDAGSDMPVGTALALIEQGSITFSAVHARLHESQKRVLAILHRINGCYLDDEVTVEELGELVVGRKDFQGPMDVIPVSDPNIFSDAQRYAQNQAAMAMAEKFPGAFKLPKLISRALQLMNYPAWEEVLNFPSEPRKMDALSENVKASDEQSQLKAFNDQDDLVHLKMHLHFMASPMFCSNPMMAMPALPKLLAHCKEHLLALYQKHVKAGISAAKSVMPEAKEEDLNIKAAALVDQELAKELAPLMPLLEAAQKLVKELTPPPQDPKAAAQLQIAQAKIAADAAEGDKDRQAEMAKDQSETARSTQEMEVAARNADLATRSEEQERFMKLLLAHMQADNQRALQAAADQAQIIMADIKAGREADAEQRQQYQDSVKAEFDRLQALMTQKNASATDSADRQLQHIETLAQHAKEVGMQEAEHAHQAEQAEADRQAAAEQKTQEIQAAKASAANKPASA
jgi:hypothetical protein